MTDSGSDLLLMGEGSCPVSVRALLFEYAHTLGHGVEAWLAGVHERAAKLGLDTEDAVRNHGQCVGMAVVWAGEMSRRLGALTGDGYNCHQAMVYLFNSFGGFSFGPVRALADALGITKAEFVHEVLEVVRLDNKRGYVECADCTKSVDQLVTRRPGQMLRSDDSNAEVRYLVTVDEAWQQSVLERAFDMEFDNVAHLEPSSGTITFAPLATRPRPPADSAAVADALRRRISALYADDECLASAPSEAPTASALESDTSMGDAQPESVKLLDNYKENHLEDGTRASLLSEGARGQKPEHNLVRRACPEGLTGDTLGMKKQRASLVQADIKKMPDFSDTLPANYREGYRAWRKGRAHGAKGEIDRPSSPAHRLPEMLI